MTTHKIQVIGKVQGVYFRVSAKQKALNLGLRGYVRNNPDGSVQLEVEGSDEAVSNMIKWCKKGPALARVSKVNAEAVSPKSYAQFSIER